MEHSSRFSASGALAKVLIKRARWRLWRAAKRSRRAIRRYTKPAIMPAASCRVADFTSPMRPSHDGHQLAGLNKPLSSPPVAAPFNGHHLHAARKQLNWAARHLVRHTNEPRLNTISPSSITIIELATLMARRTLDRANICHLAAEPISTEPPGGSPGAFECGESVSRR